MTLKFKAKTAAQLRGWHERGNFCDDSGKERNTNFIDFDAIGVHGVEVDHRVSEAHVSHP